MLQAKRSSRPNKLADPAAALAYEQNLRRTLIDSVTREQAVEFIVRFLQRNLSAAGGHYIVSPRMLYSRSMR